MEVFPIVVIMLTLNEEFHLADVIENIVGWAEDIFIVDSCSTDRTYAKWAIVEDNAL